MVLCHSNMDIIIWMVVLVASVDQISGHLHMGTTKCDYVDKYGKSVEVCANMKDKSNVTYDKANNYMACFVSWSNTTEDGIIIHRKGCALNQDSCRNKSECVGYSTMSLYYCCCDKDMCNLDFRFDVKPKDKEPQQLPSTGDGEEDMIRRTGDHPVSRTILFAVVPIVAIVFLVIATFFVCRRYYHPNSRGHSQLPTADPSCPVMATGGGYSTVLNNGGGHSTQQLALNLQFLELKAYGRYGTVWKAQVPGQFVAVKVFPGEDRQSWLTELEIYSLPQMKHDNILKFITCEEREEVDTTKLWLISEYHDRGSVCEFLKNNTVTWAELCHIGETMACGLSYLHDEIPGTASQAGKVAVAHRDLKSKNVLLKHDLTACIADFGLALKFEPSKPVSETHLQVGTRRYMAPEVLEGAICFNRDSFLRIDMYACGLIIWELMSRCTAVDGPVSEYRLPFEAEVGQQPTLEDMHTVVVTHKIRPALNTLWQKHSGLYNLIPTVEECWDQDAEARLSAGCVQERFRQVANLVNTADHNTDHNTPSELISDYEPPTIQQPLLSNNGNNNNNNINNVVGSQVPPSQHLPPMYVVPPTVVQMGYNPNPYNHLTYNPPVIDVSRDMAYTDASNFHSGTPGC